MSHLHESNGRRTGANDRRLLNPYADAATEAQPPEIVEFEIETDPYRNLLPGMSSVYAARTVGRGLREGRRGNRIMLAVSLLLVAVIVLPALLAVLAQVVR